MRRESAARLENGRVACMYDRDTLIEQSYVTEPAKIGHVGT